MLLKYLLVASVAILSADVEAAKILGLFWTPSRSHHIAASSLLQSLAKKGHDVHLISTFNDKVDIPTYKQELLVGYIEMFHNQMDPNNSFVTKFMNFFPTIKTGSELFWQNEPIQRLIKTKPEYDVVIVQTFFNDFVLAVAHHLDAPVIVFSSMGSSALTNKFVGNPNLPYAGQILQSSSTNSFSGRLVFASINILLSVVDCYVIAPMQEKINKKYLPDAPSIDQLAKNVSLVLVNSHYSIEAPRPYVPNMVQIGGFHTQKVKPLPKDLQTYLDSAKDGAILFSMGSNVKIALNFNEQQLEAIMNTFGKIAPIKVLFKSEIPIPTAPKNVLVSDWLPQNEVLAHHNIKAFVSHGGLGGTTEAIFHGVPMLGIPFFADQHNNIASTTEMGLSIMLEANKITQETFDEAIKELLSNPKYTKNAKKRSLLLRNQPVKPLENAIWWVEHIIEHKGGEHLRNLGMQLKWYQLYMVDIVFFYTAVISLILIIMFYTTRWTLRKICKRFGVCRKHESQSVKVKQN